MSRASLVYIILLVVCGGGVFWIVRIGSQLHATPDLAGVWDVTDAAGVADKDGSSLTIEQSGRFVQVQFSNGTHLDLKAHPPTPANAAGDRDVHLAGGGWKMTARFEKGDFSRAGFRLEGPRRATFSATRRSPAPAAKKPGGHAAAGVGPGFRIARFSLP